MNSNLKKLLFIIFTLLIMSVSSFLLTFVLNYLDDYRNIKVQELMTEAKAETEIHRKIILLSEVIALAPNNDSKLELAKLHYQVGNSEGAIRILEELGCNNILVCDYLAQIGEYKKIEKMSINLPADVKEELQMAKQVYEGDYSVLKDLPPDPKTNVVKLLVYLNTENYLSISKLDLFNNNLIKIADSSLNQNSLILTIAKEFNQSRLPNLSLLVTGNINWQSKPVFEIKAESYSLLGNYQKAYEIITQAINNDPSDKSLYEEAFVLAEKLENPEKIDLLKDNYNKLLKLSE